MVTGRVRALSDARFGDALKHLHGSVRNSRWLTKRMAVAAGDSRKELCRRAVLAALLHQLWSNQNQGLHFFINLLRIGFWFFCLLLRNGGDRLLLYHSGFW